MSEEPIICVESIHKSYIMGREAVEALRGVSLCVARGEIVCLMGPSGSGKTTLLNILGGLDAPSRGHVVVDGENVVALHEEALARMRLRKMGFVFQAYNLLGNFTAEENVEVPMVLAGMKNGDRKKRVKELVAMVGLADRAHHYPSELSGGQQQRVAIARAMANDPAILVGDEMTGDLDSTTGFEIMELVTKLSRERGTTVVYVTHDPRMAKYAHRVIQLRDGKIFAENGNGKDNPAATIKPGELVIDDDGKLIVDRGKH
jgi:putative ABC transport system ATP-binding protein